jgi:hypothetical protein
MDNLKALGRGTQVMFIAAVLLLIVMFFHWQEVDTAIGSFGQNAWHGFWGVVMGILTIVLVARIAARLAAVEVPIPLSFATTSFVLGILIAICAVLKLLTDDYRNFWAFVGVVLAIAVAVGAWLEVQEAGGIESLKSDASNFGSSASAMAGSAAATDAPAPSTPPPPAAPAPATPTAAETEHDAADTSASEAPGMASQAPDAPAEAADAASDATSDEPSTERES